MVETDATKNDGTSAISFDLFFLSSLFVYAVQKMLFVIFFFT
jgi:hypothetical protein